MMGDVIATPCIGICQIDPASRHCIGCARTLQEIAGWASYTAEQRERVMRQLPERRQMPRA